MTTRTNGGVKSGESLTGNMDFFTVNTVIELEEGDYGSAASATRNLIRFIETISMGAQPVLVSLSSTVADLSNATVRNGYGFGTAVNQASTEVFTLKFAIEHSETFLGVSEATDAAKAHSLTARLDGTKMPFGGVDVNTTDAANKNTSVTAFAIL